jgi:hypothetical protein
MRILVADQNALLLAAITATFGRHCDLVTASSRDLCLEHAGRQKFDLVVAGDKLVDYTGLELLSEMAQLSPGTLLVLAASPARLKRLGNRLQLFGLLETIAAPLTPRKLLETLQRARRSLPPKSAPPPVRHVVLESQWDTGERLGLIEREIENESAESSSTHEGWLTQDEGLVHGAPDATASSKALSVQVGFETEAALDDFVFAPPPPSPQECAPEIELAPAAVPTATAAGAEDLASSAQDDADPDGADLTNDPIFDQPEVPPEPQWAEDGAANDIAFESKSATASAPSVRTPTASHGTRGSNKVTPGSDKDTAEAHSATRKPAEVASPGIDKRPKVRTASQPTAAQLEAFQRALARRNAERSGHIEPADGGAAAAGRHGEGVPLAGHSEGTTRRAGASWTAGSLSASSLSARSLSEIARMAANKRPLVIPKLNLSSTPPKRAVFMVGSGLAAVLIVGALFFELLRTPSGATEHLARAPATQTPFAASSRTPATNNGNYSVPDEGEHFTPAPPPPMAQPAAEQTEQPAPMTAYPEGYDSFGNPLPLPPPAVERPGPTEPPSTSSMELRGPPVGMVPPGFEPQPE